MGSDVILDSVCAPLPDARAAHPSVPRVPSAPPRDHAAGVPGPPVAILQTANRRMQRERRLVYDRRRLIRFDTDRRFSAERRFGVEVWAIP